MLLNKYPLITVVVLFFIGVVAPARGQSLEWEKRFGGKTTEDMAFAVLQTPDGGYLTAGYAIAEDNHRNMPGHLVKFDGTGKQQWERKVGSAVRLDVMIPRQGGGYFLAGLTAPTLEAVDLFIAAIDEDGNFQWVDSIPEPDNLYVTAMVSTSDGGFAVTGTRWDRWGREELQAVLYKFDRSGRLEWKRAFSGRRGQRLVQCSDGGYGIYGWYEDRANLGGRQKNGFLLRLDDVGDSLWMQSYPVVIRGDMVTTPDNDFMIAQITDSLLPYRVMDVRKVTANGELEWNLVHSDSVVRYNFFPQAMCAMPDGGYSLFGSNRNGSPSVLRLDGKGVQLWFQVYSSATDGMFRDLRAIAPTRDGGIILAGSANMIDQYIDILLVKISGKTLSTESQETLPTRMYLY